MRLASMNSFPLLAVFDSSLHGPIKTAAALSDGTNPGCQRGFENRFHVDPSRIQTLLERVPFAGAKAALEAAVGYYQEEQRK